MTIHLYNTHAAPSPRVRSARAPGIVGHEPSPDTARLARPATDASRPLMRVAMRLGISQRLVRVRGSCTVAAVVRVVRRRDVALTSSACCTGAVVPTRGCGVFHDESAFVGHNDVVGRWIRQVAVAHRRGGGSTTQRGGGRGWEVGDGPVARSRGEPRDGRRVGRRRGSLLGWSASDTDGRDVHPSQSRGSDARAQSRRRSRGLGSAGGAAWPASVAPGCAWGGTRCAREGRALQSVNGLSSQGRGTDHCPHARRHPRPGAPARRTRPCSAPGTAGGSDA